MTVTSIALRPARTWQVSSEATALLEKFPPRPAPASWPRTRQDRAAVEDRLAKPPFRAHDCHARRHRKLSLQAMLDWLELYPARPGSSGGRRPAPAARVTAIGGSNSSPTSTRPA
jgi:hypothetical protein